MDLNESTIPVSMSDSRPISPSPITETAGVAQATETIEVAPATVEETKPGDSSVKRKRGRPRKYDSNGKLINPSRTPDESSFSRRTKRPLGKCRGYPLMRLGGGDFTPHILTINTGEDIIGRIMSFTQNGSRGICILSANGAVSDVKILPLGFSTKVLTFEGVYEILSLNHSMVMTKSGGLTNEIGGWQISIGGVNGCLFGGYLAGRLIAACPVQVVIGSYWSLISNPSVVVTPTIPNTLAFTSTRQVQQPEMGNPSHYLNRGWYGSGPQQ